MSDENVTTGGSVTTGGDVDLSVVAESLIVNAVSPRARVVQDEGGATITLTDFDGTTTARVLNGAQGAQGEKGEKGDPGDVSQADLAAMREDVAPISRVTSLDATALAGASVVEVLGVPAYVADVSIYSAYGLTEPGWYAFCRITAKAGVLVTADTAVTGAAGCVKTIGSDHVDIAVRFDVAAMTQIVTVNWGASIETFAFKATDLAVRNLDYRTTFYVYDAAPFVTWEYALATDATFAEDKKYFTKSGESYTKATVTIGDAVPAVYYEHAYELTTDETFQDGKTYYVLSDNEYVQATVTPGDVVTPNVYYESVYSITEDATFQDGKLYYTKSGTTYTQAEVTVGESVPPVYYVHSKCIFAGLTRNVTYKFDEIIDCASEFILPEIEDDTHGCWYEIRLMHAGSYSMTLTPASPSIKVATEHTQAESKGINMVDLHYSDIAGNKVWRFMNTHSSFTADASPLVSIAFRKPPTTTTYSVGDALATAGAEIVATYEDGHTKLVTATYTPANGTALTAENTELVASYTENNVTATASVALTVS